jgi:CheY-like chemotaxis protein
VELPLTAASASARNSVADSPQPAQALNILLVEDDATVAEVIVGLLHVRGHNVTHAAHGLAALSMVGTRVFDIALLDLDLPGLGGLALARQLRSQSFDAPLVAVTARADAEAEPLAKAAGFNGFLRKPLTGELLAAAMQRAIESVVENRKESE